MPAIYLILSILLLIGSFYKNRSELIFIFLGLIIWSLLGVLGASDSMAIIVAVAVSAIGLVLQYNVPLRRSFITDRLFKTAAGVLPKMSETEKTALEAGTVWFDGDIFSGNPDWTKLMKEPAFKLSKEEQKFIDGPVNKLCEMLDD